MSPSAGAKGGPIEDPDLNRENMLAARAAARFPSSEGAPCYADRHAAAIGRVQIPWIKTFARRIGYARALIPLRR